MNRFFCADNSRLAGEDIIGSASNHQTYILVECPPPWKYDTFSSKWVPNNLKDLVQEVKRAKLPIRFLLIANNHSHKKDETTLLIYQKKEGITNGFRRQEFTLEKIEYVALFVRKWLRGKYGDYELKTTPKRDILVCTDGNHDKCCARYGNPLYFHGTNMISDFNLHTVRLWRSSHFGGHRFAPTMIDLPEGRYYGRVDQESFYSILTRTGNIQCMNEVYRGWGILPSPMQVLERELMLRYGWDWFNNKVAARILEESPDGDSIKAELVVEQPYGDIHSYLAKIVKEETQTVQLKSSCNAKQESVFVKYAVAGFWVTSKTAISHIA
ncbi:MAG: sucrase ferredoxin [Nostocaceae cyanobacterium]|nr:sucrase ferredoxin [Nostocaceae cyanobacterium]